MSRITGLALVALASFSSAQTYEAEDAVLSGVEVATEQAGFTGTGYVTGFDLADDKITFTVEGGAEAVLYDVSLTYAGIYGEKTTTLILNGGASSAVVLPATEAFTDVTAGQLLLEPGANTIDLVSNWGYYLIDSLTLSPSEAPPPHNISPSLVNPEAGPEAVALYDYLTSIYGSKILSGQQELVWADYVEEQTGKRPALVAVDFIDYSPSRVEYQGEVSIAVEDAIEHHEAGGIVSVLWHWNAPAGLYDTAEQPWWSGFYTRATDFDVASALADTTNANYTLLVRDIDAIAVQLLRLQEAGVPVLWRPLHEAEGAWFWWGAQGPEPCIALWDLLYDRLTNFHGLNNLVWVWNSIAADWYPGDATVDILGADVYATGNGVSRLRCRESLADVVAFVDAVQPARLAGPGHEDGCGNRGRLDPSAGSAAGV